MKRGIKYIKTTSNEYILLTNSMNKNVKHEIIKYWKIQDLKKGIVGTVISNQKIIGFRFLLACNSTYCTLFKILYIQLLHIFMGNVHKISTLNIYIRSTLLHSIILSGSP